jgi:hypothetical protein
MASAEKSTCRSPRALRAQVTRRATPRVQVVLQLHLRELAQRVRERRGPVLAHQQAIQAAQEVHALRAAELGERREHLEQRRHALQRRKRIHFREHGLHRVQELAAELLADVGELQLARFGLDVDRERDEERRRLRRLARRTLERGRQRRQDLLRPGHVVRAGPPGQLRDRRRREHDGAPLQLIRAIRCRDRRRVLPAVARSSSGAVRPRTRTAESGRARECARGAADASRRPADALGEQEMRNLRASASENREPASSALIFTSALRRPFGSRVNCTAEASASDSRLRDTAAWIRRPKKRPIQPSASTTSAAT